MNEPADSRSEALEIGAPVDMSLSLDHGQFLVLDRDSMVHVDAYDEESQATGIAQFDGGVVVFTDSHWSSQTPLRVNLANEPPAFDLATAQHVVISGIKCASGELRIFSPEETGANERSLILQAGSFGLLAYGSGFGHANTSGDNGSDRYELWLWPVRHLPSRRCIKSGLPNAETPRLPNGWSEDQVRTGLSTGSSREGRVSEREGHANARRKRKTSGRPAAPSVPPGSGGPLRLQRRTDSAPGEDVSVPLGRAAWPNLRSALSV